MPGKTNQARLVKALASNQRAGEPGEEIPGGVSQIGCCAKHSWSRPRCVRLNRISSPKSQVGESRKDLSASEYVCRAGLRESPLGSGYVQQIAESIVIRFEHCVVGAVRGFEQGSCGFALPKGGI